VKTSRLFELTAQNRGSPFIDRVKQKTRPQKTFKEAISNFGFRKESMANYQTPPPIVVMKRRESLLPPTHSVFKKPVAISKTSANSIDP
jgi:hypothetical protein